MYKLTIQIGIWASILGILSGIIELSIGFLIREWIGNKENPVILGFVTLLLSVLALVSILSARSLPSLGNNSRLAIFLGVFIPSVICFTTVGRLWYIPGPMLLATAFLLAYSFWIQPAPLGSTDLAAGNGLLFRLLGILGAILILSAFGLAFFKPLFALFQTETSMGGKQYRFEILPMDFIRRTVISSAGNTSEDFEVSLVRIVQILLVLGASISLTASLVASRLFLGVGCLVSFSALALFLFSLPTILQQAQFPLEGYISLLGSLSLGWYISLLGMILFFIAWIQPIFLRAGR
ncbi:hypothetical protein SpiGrapes_0058 [Sphaerochaeta pleomorpha str. Grapes]|uniref:Uncharacterized protein n=1 Tax=Sphaerochaeta pleomorpha (strain ATCC BAA-1885 / DSM 22778 / Grapes) TaxID=158190 RepID=G8QT17_SPHPG|nr:hypothetical protein [Sphaerochaeta pleomorpha]AEV27922.1 hypothetical protein SpiGrapes_0058 [Sphaerochaeta pleomorpha str. Grapes]